MKTLKLLTIISLAGALFTWSSCNVENDRGLFKIGSITHSAIDWSEDGEVPADYGNADGETVAWCPLGTQIQGIVGIWYRNNSNAGAMYNLGNVELSSVTSFNASLADSDICDQPMIVGDVWVMDCLDGYVKFKVTSVEDVNSQDWAVGVEYEFSTTTTFS